MQPFPAEAGVEQHHGHSNSQAYMHYGFANVMKQGGLQEVWIVVAGSAQTAQDSDGVALIIGRHLPKEIELGRAEVVCESGLFF